jgi:hypothetical protein
VKLESKLIYPELAREEIICEQLNETLEDLLTTEKRTDSKRNGRFH